MPIRFSTEAANADFLVDDSQRTPASSGTSQSGGADRAWDDRFSRGPRQRQAPSGDAGPAQGRPGKDINAAGFLKDKDPTPT